MENFDFRFEPQPSPLPHPNGELLMENSVWRLRCVPEAFRRVLETYLFVSTILSKYSSSLSFVTVIAFFISILRLLILNRLHCRRNQYTFTIEFGENMCNNFRLFFMDQNQFLSLVIVSLLSDGCRISQRGRQPIILVNSSEKKCVKMKEISPRGECAP